MTEFTPARLAELKAVAEAATEPDYYVCDCYVQCGDEVCPNTKPIFTTHDNDTVLALIAALEEALAALERVNGHFFKNRLYLTMMSHPALNNAAGEALHDKIDKLIQQTIEGTHE